MGAAFLRCERREELPTNPCPSRHCTRCQWFHVPLDDLQVHAPDGGDHVVIVLPKGRPEEGGADTGDGLDLIVAGVDVGDDLVGGEGVEVGVVVGVAHDLVAGVG